MVSGALLTLAPIEAIFFLDVVTAALAIGIFILFLHVPPHTSAQARNQTSFFQDLGKGFAYIRERPNLFTFYIYYALVLILITPAVALTRLQVVRAFGADVWRLSTIDMA